MSDEIDLLESRESRGNAKVARGAASEPDAPITARQRQLVSRIRSVLSADRQVTAAWLAGSFARKEADELSDVDVVVLVRGSASEVGARYAANIGQIGRAVLVRTKVGGRIINVVSDDWARFDLKFIEPGELDDYAGMPLIPLCGDAGNLRVSASPPVSPPSAEALVGLVSEFLRVLGLSVPAVLRGEWLLAQSGIGMLRQMTIDLMLEASGLDEARRGGAFRLNRVLSPFDRRALEALPPALPDRLSIVAANVALARLFLPKARLLVQQVGAEWPKEFEAATLRHVAKIGITVRYPALPRLRLLKREPLAGDPASSVRGR